MSEARNDHGWLTGVLVAGCGCLAVLFLGGAFFLVFGFSALGRTTYPAFPATPPMVDEQTVRAELHVPPAATLVSLTSNPGAGGTFGREGLRIVATFELGPAELASYQASRATRPGWAPLPLPSEAADFRMPPVELPASAERGLAFCQTGVWATGTTFTPHPCAPPPARFDQYRAAVLDEDAGRLTVVFKNYY